MKNLLAIITLLLTTSLLAKSQQTQSVSDIKCGFNPTNNFNEVEAFANSTDKYENQVFSITDSSDCNQHYVIPVVFHVFTDDAVNRVPLVQIQSALDILNRDMNGLNDDYETVDPYFYDRRAKMNITFALPSIDPEGKPTNGVTYHPKNAGFGNHISYDDSVRKYAWDNYKYMNVYIMLDLYANDVTNQSGIAWYPNKYMSDNNLARIVYNYSYLGNQGSSFADANFQSVFTHEAGHWLNLAHTFQGGCEGENDFVEDTPSTLASAGCGPNTFSCGHPANGDNYMDYTDCYSMFTKGQVERMLTALKTHPARFPLWQIDNLKATGTFQYYKPAVPGSQFTASSDTILEGQSITFTDISCGDPSEWEWTFEGGFPAVSQEKNPIIQYTKSGNYTASLVATNEEGSSKTSTMGITVIRDINSSANETSESLELFIYPNPTADRFEIRNLQNSIYQYCIYDNLGNVLIEGNISKSKASIDLEKLNSGVYFLRVISDSKEFNSKVIKY